ncbi:MAG: bifunctional diguanylate cyclase/phosphodiesterase [Methylococcales bacterium]|nr:bifunctional diguanylate cyclase/phosphodiesterase [Methylococcales bacterium]
MDQLPQNVPERIEGLRMQLMRQLFALLESQTRTRTFAANISKLTQSRHQGIIKDLARLQESLPDGGFERACIAKAIEACANLDQALSCLVDERQRQWYKNGQYLKSVVDELHQTTNMLSCALVEKDLLEKQSQVLENIILSHEKVSQWKAFVQEILHGFHAIFPFNFFFIAFAEEQGLSMYFYYMGVCDEALKKEVRDRLGREMLDKLHLPHDALLDIEEFLIDTGAQLHDVSDIKLITVPVPDKAYGLDGLLGVAYASINALTAQEQAIVRYVLSVMVMVVGSSKVLSRTLSELEYYSVHDPLTGIHNRRYFNDMLEYEINRSLRHQHEFAVLLLDLDDFKDINDSYGHPLGDEVLKKIAETITGELRKGDIATRMGGDEFAVILPETSPEGAKVAAESIRTTLEALAFHAPEQACFHITTSVGLICYPKDMQTVEELMSGVDVALYRAKGRGKNEVCEFDPSLNHAELVKRSRAYVEDLRQALQEERVKPYFQPIVDCQTGEVFAYESVARLIGKDGTITSAGQFIETIEKYSLGRELDRIIVRKVMGANREIMDLGQSPKRLFINLSAQEIQGRGILGYAEQLCVELKVPPSCIVFEILERDAISDITHMGKFLSNLRNKGFAFALDDFGSGYNSFHYLRELHFEYVKIDGAFVRNMTHSRVDRALVRNLSRLCQELGILTIGEFVENQQIYDMLLDMGVNYGQGYHIGMPLSHF